MKTIVWQTVFRTWLPALLLVRAALGQGLTTADRDHALTYLEETRAGVANAVKGLSAAQWNFKPAPDRWSIEEIVEHLAIAENYVSEKIFVKLQEAPAPASNRDLKESDAAIVSKTVDRTEKFKAPPPIAPAQHWEYTEALERFNAARANTVEFLKSASDLRQHAINHPAFGSLDGYQWILFVAAHSARHTQQISEVKASPNFPKN